MRTIILDTNIIIECLRFKIDLFTELRKLCDFNFEIAILDKTLDELKGKPFENLALSLKDKFRVIKTNSSLSVDDILLAHEEDIVATVDSELKEKLKSKGIQVITIKQKNRFMWA
ncbi:hypothetical protein HYT58_00330 [Candidatus Woesearchaeota archaeon]|nr:hypothetical protein [Candidatus Woesearchaeota archaeon]